jgi:hypothetical protein
VGYPVDRVSLPEFPISRQQGGPFEVAEGPKGMKLAARPQLESRIAIRPRGAWRAREVIADSGGTHLAWRRAEAYRTMTNVSAKTGSTSTAQYQTSVRRLRSISMKRASILRLRDSISALCVIPPRRG